MGELAAQIDHAQLHRPGPRGRDGTQASFNLGKGGGIVAGRGDLRVEGGLTDRRIQMFCPPFE
jgi:hypothetical protein